MSVIIAEIRDISKAEILGLLYVYIIQHKRKKCPKIQQEGAETSRSVLIMLLITYRKQTNERTKKHLRIQMKSYVKLLHIAPLQEQLETFRCAIAQSCWSLRAATAPSVPRQPLKQQQALTRKSNCCNFGVTMTHRSEGRRTHFRLWFDFGMISSNWLVGKRGYQLHYHTSLGETGYLQSNLLVIGKLSVKCFTFLAYKHLWAIMPTAF